MEKNLLMHVFNNNSKSRMYWINLFCFLLLVAAYLFDHRDRFLTGVILAIQDFTGK